jgi:hypothetical protein
VPIRKELRHFYRGPAWQAAREACRERAGDRCEQCGRTNGTFYENDRGRRVLVQCGAAHLNNTAGDDRPENLGWLCRGCHLRTDKPFHRLSRATRKDARRPLIAGLEASL